MSTGSSKIVVGQASKVFQMEKCRSLVPTLLVLTLLVACQAPATAPTTGAAAQPARPAAANTPATTSAVTAQTPPAAERGPAVRLPEPTPLVIGATPGAAFPAYIAFERGYFAEVNIDAQLEDVTGTEIVPLLTTGRVDVGMHAASPGLFNSIGRGLPITLILDYSHFAPGGRSHMILARQELYDAGQLRSVEQLKDRRVALASVPGGLVIDLDRALQRVGVSVDDVDMVQLPFAEHAAGLANGSIDAAVMFDPLASHATARQVATPIRYINEDYPEHQVAFTMISTRLLEQPAVVRAFAVAYLRGARDYERARRSGTDVEAVAAIIAKYNRQDPSLVAAMLPNGRMTATDPDGRLKVDSIQYDVQWYRDRGHVARDLSVADFVDHQYADYAAGVLGPFR